MTPVQIVGIGLEGAASLTPAIHHIVQTATVLVGSDRHLSYFPDHPAERLSLGNFQDMIEQIRQRLADPGEPLRIVVLVSGDPLFFGLGRLLLEELPPDLITIHPALSSIQLAFSRVKVAWQDANVISAHGRSLDELIQALQQGTPKLAVLTDPTNTPAAIARLLLALDLPTSYQCWVCEHLGGAEEQVQCFQPEDLIHYTAAALNVVILLRSPIHESDQFTKSLPLLGLPDHAFLSFGDRPGLMTKREVRVQILAELALQPHQIVWDIGAGTGSVSIEIARLCPASKIYAIEKTAAGKTLIEQNSDRFQVNNIIAIHGRAPAVLHDLPAPDRIFIGGSGGDLDRMLDHCRDVLRPDGVIVLAIATLENLQAVLNWHAQAANQKWPMRLLQVQVARSLPIASLTRFAPLNPVTLVTLHQGRSTE